jgi:uncharacterized cupredoxin-like copper-binding protein
VRHAAALFALALLAGCGSAGTLDQKAFQKEAESIQSLAAEGALLAGDVADGKSTVPFTRVHAGELHEQAVKLEETLSTAAAEPEVEDELAEAVALAGDVAASLDQLERSPGDTQLARGAQRKLETAAIQAEDLAGA